MCFVVESGGSREQYLLWFVSQLIENFVLQLGP